MFVRASFQFRLYPKKSQTKLLQAQLGEHWWLYSEQLVQRKLSYKKLDTLLSKYKQIMLLLFLEEGKPALKAVHSQVLQNIVDRLNKSFRAFFRTSNAGDKPGFSRFRGVHRCDKFCYSDSKLTLFDKDVFLSKIGCAQVKTHLPIEGEVKTCTIKKTVLVEWDVAFPSEVSAIPLEWRTGAMEVDVGIESFATLANRNRLPDVGIQCTGISTQRKIFWSSDWTRTFDTIRSHKAQFLMYKELRSILPPLFGYGRNQIQRLVYHNPALN